MPLKANNYYIKHFLRSGKYKVTRDGRIFSIASGNEVGYTKSDGYRYVSYVVSGKTHRLKIHRIVWCAYGDTKLSEYLVINHKDGNPSNNNIDNLEQVTQAQNNLHRFRVLKYSPVIGNSKITREQAEEIRELRKQGWKFEDLMAKFKVGKTTISYVVNNKIWK